MTQRGSIFQPLAERLAGQGHAVTAVDLRGHGASGRQPPWDTGTHVADLLETADALGIERAAWIGHSFGGRLVAALAATAPERVSKLVLLDPALELSPEFALRSAEMDRLDWSFETIDGATEALLAADTVVASPREAVREYVRNDVQRGSDGRYRFSYCASAAVVAWSEATLPAPPVQDVPTLIVRPVASHLNGRGQDVRYRKELGSRVAFSILPHGHNVLWEAPAETMAAVESFLGG